MRALHAVRSMYSGTDQSAFDVRPRTPRRSDIRSVIGIDVRRIVDFSFFCKRYQPFHHFIVVRPVTVLDAYRNLRFFTFEIRTDTPHIYRQKFCGVSTDGSRAVADLFIVGKIEIDIAGGSFPLLLHSGQYRQKAGAPRLIVEKSRFDKTAFRHRGFWIERDQTSRADTERLYVRSGINFFVETYIHRIFVTFQSSRVSIDMTGTGIG